MHKDTSKIHIDTEQSFCILCICMSNLFLEASSYIGSRLRRSITASIPPVLLTFFRLLLLFVLFAFVGFGFIGLVFSFCHSLHRKVISSMLPQSDDAAAVAAAGSERARCFDMTSTAGSAPVGFALEGVVSGLANWLPLPLPLVLLLIAC